MKHSDSESFDGCIRRGPISCMTGVY